MRGLRDWAQKHFNFRTFSRYSLGGFVSYLFNIAIVFVLTDVFGMHYLFSFILSLALTTLLNFILAIKFVFNVRKGLAGKLALYIASIAVFYLLNILLVRWLVEGIGIYYLLAIVLSTIVLFAVKFFIYDKWVFADERPKAKRT